MIMFEKRPPELGSNDIRCLCELNGWLKFIPVKGTFQLQCGSIVMYSVANLLFRGDIIVCTSTKQYLRSVGYSFRFQLLFQSNLQCSGGVYN